MWDWFRFWLDDLIWFEDAPVVHHTHRPITVKR